MEGRGVGVGRGVGEKRKEGRKGKGYTPIFFYLD